MFSPVRCTGEGGAEAAGAAAPPRRRLDRSLAAMAEFGLEAKREGDLARLRRTARACTSLFNRVQRWTDSGEYTPPNPAPLCPCNARLQRMVP